MLLDGVSVRGPYKKVNQDSFAVKSLDRGFVVALSDGLGSKEHSDTGSAAVCRSVLEVAEELGEELFAIEGGELVRKIHERWLTLLDPYPVSDCYATMLFFLRYRDRVLAARLGDGFIGLGLDGCTEVLFDRKEEYFANETDSMSEELELPKVEFLEKTVLSFRGGLACSDGVEICDVDENQLKRFTEEFIQGYEDMPGEEIVADIEGWLSDWTGTDDRTLAFCLTESDT